MLIDTHAHLNFRAFRKDRAEVISRCRDEGLRVINVGSQYQTSLVAVELAGQYPETLSAAIGFHPVHISDTDFNPTAFNELAEQQADKIVAIGEIGLDFYRLPDDAPEKKAALIDQQKTVLRFFLSLAERQKLPVILHCRDAYEELLAELKSEHLIAGGVLHCFLGSPDIADRFLDLGIYLGFTGIITFTDDMDLLNLVKRLPLERLLIETDAPYLAPAPYRRQRNEPIYVKHVAEKIAELKNISYQNVVEATTKNAERLFKINKTR